MLIQHIHATEITRTKKGYTALNREKENGRIENSSLLIFLASILWDRVDRFVVPSAIPNNSLSSKGLLGGLLLHYPLS